MGAEPAHPRSRPAAQQALPPESVHTKTPPLHVHVQLVAYVPHLTVAASVHFVDSLAGLVSGHAQTLPLQVPPLHTWPQAPQLFTSLKTEVSQPQFLPVQP